MSNDIFICRNAQEEVIIVNMKTCQKLILKDKALMSKTDEELKSIYMNYGVVSQNSRV